MNPLKIVGLVGVAIAIIAAFATIPYVAAILVVLGLIYGYGIKDEQVRVIVSALALGALSGSLTAVPTIGSYLAAIVANLGVYVGGVALIIILRNIYGRLVS
jgi:predicted histidine transporter YuiF (NhaC family)